MNQVFTKLVNNAATDVASKAYKSTNIDASNIITGSRRRSRAPVRKPIPKKVKKVKKLQPKPVKKKAPKKNRSNIDASNIIESGRGRRRKRVNYAEMADDAFDNDETFDPEEDLNPRLPDANQRFEQIVKELDRKPVKPDDYQFKPLQPIEGQRRLLLFLNLGDDKIFEAINAFETNQPPPAWTKPFKGNLQVKNDVLYFMGLPVATSNVKRNAIKSCYFSPKLPSTIEPIHLHLRDQYANITRKNVKSVLKSLEVYQINYSRRKPGPVKASFVATAPGSIIVCDMFFPQTMNGWAKNQNVLVMADSWSRFTKAYVVRNKSFQVVKKAMLKFFQALGRFGVIPRRGLSDKGTDLSPFKAIFEAYRLPRDGNKPLVFHSKTGMPVSYVESLNAQIERRMQIFATGNITSDASRLIDDICDQINNQRIPAKMNHTPNELIRMDSVQTKQINKQYVARDMLHEPMKRMEPIKIGDQVRVLMMTVKEQNQGAKQFKPKWSRDLFLVVKKTRVKRDVEWFRYFLNNRKSYYRWELLLCNKVDTTIPKNINLRNSNIIG